MIEHNKNFYSLEELKRTRDRLEGYLDNEEVYYFVGVIRYACDEIERLNNIINKRIERYDVDETINGIVTGTLKYVLDKLYCANKMLEKENEILKHRLNDIIFDDANNDVELGARYLRKIGYIDFDEDRKVYINKHNEEPFLQENEREKDYYITDKELDKGE